MKDILTRRSIRKYDLSKKVDVDILKKLCLAGLAAPSARRQDSSSFIMIDDKELIQKLSTISKGAIILANCNTAIAVLGKRSDLVTAPQMQDQDLAAATENILIAARQLNLGTCWIGVSPITERVLAAGNILNIPDTHYVFALITVGYPESEDVFCELKKDSEARIHYNQL